MACASARVRALRSARGSPCLLPGQPSSRRTQSYFYFAVIMRILIAVDRTFPGAGGNDEDALLAAVSWRLRASGPGGEGAPLVSPGDQSQFCATALELSSLIQRLQFLVISCRLNCSIIVST